jgi:opine dehydrogenase
VLAGLFETRATNTVLEAALLNANPVLHPAEVLLNVGKVETAKEGFQSHDEGFTPGVARISVGVADELCKLAAPLGIELDFVSGMLAFFARNSDRQAVVEVEGLDVGARAQLISDGVRSSPLAAIASPAGLNSRYLEEDIPYGLAMWASLGAQLGVAMPLCNAMVTIATAVTGRPFAGEGRTTRRLGLDGLDANLLMHYLRTGDRQSA